VAYQDVKDYVMFEEVLDEMIEDCHPDNGGHRAIYTFLKDMRQMGYAWRSHINLIIQRADGTTSEYDEKYQAYLDRKASGLEATWNGPDEEEE